MILHNPPRFIHALNNPVLLVPAGDTDILVGLVPLGELKSAPDFKLFPAVFLR